MAFIGFGGQALADEYVDPDCDGTPYNNDNRVRDFNMSTTSPFAHEDSGITGSGLRCGTVIGGNLINPFHTPHGTDTLSNRAVITLPAGVEMNTSDTAIPNNAFVGRALVRVASWSPGAAFIDTPEAIIRKVPDFDGDCPDVAETKACYKGTVEGLLAGHNWQWVTQVGQSPDRYTLTIGRFIVDTFPNPAAGLTKIASFSLCPYASGAGGSDCGTGSSSQRWMQKNGDLSASNCENGNGNYRVVVYDQADRVTPEESTCVDWYDTEIISGPSNPTASTTAVFLSKNSSQGTAPGTSYECKLDGGNWEGCSNPKIYNNLPVGSHEFQVRAVVGGAVDPTPATWSWTIEQDVTVDPDCDGTPYNNDYAVHEFGVTTNPTTAGALSDITFNYLICGTALGAGSEGDDTVNDHVDIKQPGDSMIQNTFGIDTGSYAGRLKGRIMYRDGAGDAQVADTEAKLTVEWADLRFLERERWARNASNNWVKTNPIVDNCNRQADPGVSNVEGDNNRLGPDYLAGENIGTFDYQAWVPTDALGRPTTSLASFIPSCFKLVSTSGPFNWYAWAWGTFSVVDGHRHLTVGPIHTDTTPPAPENDDPTASFDDRQVGFTSTSDNRDPFELTICDNAGDVGANVCGSDRDPVLHRNGDGEGCYEIVATNKGAEKTAAQTACVDWIAGRMGDDIKIAKPSSPRNTGTRRKSTGSRDSGGRDSNATGSTGGSSGSAKHRGTKTRSF